MRLSVVVPTLNEGGTLAHTISVLRRRTVGPPVELIVADCGSSDETTTVAKHCGAAVETGGTLTDRARACNAGAASASGDALLFLHADSLVPDRYDALIRDALASPGVVGGAFAFKLDGPEWRLRVVERVDRMRYRVRGRYFGDQGIFARRTAFHAVGGFPEVPIKEDAHFCGAMRRIGKMRLINAPMVTSPRRFYNGGILTTLAGDIMICTRDLLGLSLHRHAERYREDNLSRGRGPGTSAAPPHPGSPAGTRSS